MSDEAPERESVLGVLGVGAGVLGILALLAFLALPRGGAVDGEERLADVFAGGIPFGLELVEAVRAPSGETIVRLARGADGGGAAGEGAAPEVAPDGSAPGEPRPPVEVALVEYPSADRLRELFAPEVDVRELDEDRRRWEDDASRTFDAAVRRDRITWSRWSAELLVVRSFDEGGDWHESARVDLSQPGRGLALLARWPPGTVVSEEALRELLRAVRLRPPEGEGTPSAR